MPEEINKVFTKNLCKLLSDHNMTQAELAERLEVGRSTISMWIKGVSSPRMELLDKIADIFDVSVGYLMTEKNDTVLMPSKGVVINVLGRVAAGIPIEAVENIIDTEEITEELARTGSFFGLRIQGDSMEPDIHNGDIVIVRQQEDAESDEIVIALVNGNDGVCKRLKKYDGSIALVSINANYEPMYFTDKEIVDKPVRIIGKVVELRRKL